MIPNNTKSGIISIIRFSGEKNTLLFQQPSGKMIPVSIPVRIPPLPMKNSASLRQRKTALRVLSPVQKAAACTPPADVEARFCM